MKILTHADSWVTVDGAKRPYLPTYDAPLPGIDRYLHAPVVGLKIEIGITGSLQRADAAKLYELAYFGEGNILELGTADGLSASIMAEALVDAGRQAVITTVDLDPRKHASAMPTLRALNRDPLVLPIVGDAASVCERLVAAGRTFGLVFVDHSHAYEHVASVCPLLDALTPHHGWVVFHDFNDRRNAQADDAAYGVYQAVQDALPETFAFAGVYGCCGVYQHR